MITKKVLILMMVAFSANMHGITPALAEAATDAYLDEWLRAYMAAPTRELRQVEQSTLNNLRSTQKVLEIAARAAYGKKRLSANQMDVINYELDAISIMQDEALRNDGSLSLDEARVIVQRIAILDSKMDMMMRSHPDNRTIVTEPGGKYVR